MKILACNEKCPMKTPGSNEKYPMKIPGSNEKYPMKEDFTLSHRFHLDSIWTPGGFPESMWSLDYFFFGGSPANFLSRIHVESMWSPVGLHVTPSGPHGLHLRTQA
jgi:hypothetical protein